VAEAAKQMKVKPLKITMQMKAMEPTGATKPTEATGKAHLP